MLEIWVELHQTWLSSRLPLNKTTKQIHRAVLNREWTDSSAKVENALEQQKSKMQKSESTNHGKSSKIGLALVLNTAMIASRSAAFGSPERKNKQDVGI